MLICSPDRPWGIHLAVHNDKDCPRCGWTAPGPKGDSIEADREARAWLADLSWTGLEDEALAA